MAICTAEQPQINKRKNTTDYIFEGIFYPFLLTTVLFWL